MTKKHTWPSDFFTNYITCS